MEGYQIVSLIIACVCLIISGFVSGSEIAFFSITTAQRQDLDDESDGRSPILRIIGRPEKLLATILIANNLVNVTIVVLTNFALGPIFGNMHPVLSFVLQSVLLTFLILLFGEILPKLYANHYPLQWAKFAVTGMRFFMTVLSPASSILVRSTSLVKHVVTEKPHAISTDELSKALEIADVHADDNKEMLEGILQFGDTSASEIMTPRIDITAIPSTASFTEALKTVVDSGFSRIPVFDGSMDQITGILFSRDLLPYIGHKEAETLDWHTLLRDPFYVPESRMIDDLLEDFRRRRQHLAIVVDEFGGTQGLVTMEDVLEEIVGDIDDEYDEDNKTYRRLPDNTFIFEGKTLLTDFFRITDLDDADYAPVTEDAETLAGMLLAIKGDFPRDKEPLVYGRCRFLVLDVTDRRIASVRVKVMPDVQTDSTTPIE